MPERHKTPAPMSMLLRGPDSTDQAWSDHTSCRLGARCHRSQPSGFGDVLSRIMFIAWSRSLLVHAADGDWRNRCGRTDPRRLWDCVLQPRVLAGKVETVSRQLWELLITFSLYPDPLFHGALRLALFTVLPAGFVGYIPARMVQAPSLSDVVLLAGGAIAYMGLAITVLSMVCGGMRLRADSPRSGETRRGRTLRLQALRP